MAGGGFHNHYDDPDEFWDDAPLERKPNSAPAKPSRQVPPPPPFNSAPTATPSAAGSPSFTSSALPSQTPVAAGPDKILNDLAQFHAYMAASRNLLKQAVESGPERLVGIDSARIVTVTLGHGREFLDVQVSPGWERSLTPPELSEAVVAAARAAERCGVTQGANNMVDSGVLARLQNMRVEDFPARSASLPQVGIDPQSNSSLDKLMDTVFRLFEAADSPPADTGDVVGRSEESEGWVTVTLSGEGALVGCTIGGYWAAGRSGSSITQALNEAAAEARRRRTTIVGSTDLSSQANRTISDAIALIAQLSQ